VNHGLLTFLSTNKMYKLIGPKILTNCLVNNRNIVTGILNNEEVSFKLDDP